MDVANLQLDGNADAVEFCPHPPFHHVLAAATYTLKEGEDQPSRSGSISLFDTNNGLDLLHRVETPGVFDIKWNPSGSNTQPFLAQVDATGSLSLYQLLDNNPGTVLRQVCAQEISPWMCLSVDWHPLRELISVGLSDGSVAIVQARESSLQNLQSWAGHEYEVWTASFDIHRHQLLYTGSDDCSFCCWDVRGSTSSNLVFKNAKSHTMGVCCIALNPANSNMLITGSYDEFLRVWDMRSTSKPVNQRSVSLGGGVWRIKFHPFGENLVLAACMHNGFAVVKIEDEDVIVVETYDKHESLAYGADWCKGGNCCEDNNGAKNEMVVATCSFYDQLLRLWKPVSTMTQREGSKE
ncbi:diphthamide biosynthesis protein 7 [Dioscorea alata]|nr:diphthamide biosynthesis protein 7 [Dioscorea alata]